MLRGIWTSAQTKNRRNYELTMYCVLDRSSNKTSIENFCVIHVHTNVTQVCVYTGHAHVPVYKLHALHLKCVTLRTCNCIMLLSADLVPLGGPADFKHSGTIFLKANFLENGSEFVKSEYRFVIRSPKLTI